MKSVVLMAPSIERLINLVNQLSSARCCILGYCRSIDLLTIGIITKLWLCRLCVSPKDEVQKIREAVDINLAPEFCKSVEEKILLIATVFSIHRNWTRSANYLKKNLYESGGHHSSSHSGTKIMDKPPKYVFGLLETPASSSLSSNRGYVSSSMFGGVRSGASTAVYQGTTSWSSLRVRPHHTPATGTSSVRSNTPGSRAGTTSGNMTPRDSSAVIVALVEGRGLAKGAVGMSSIDLKRPVLTLSQFTDSSTYVKSLDDPRFKKLQDKIEEVIHDDARIQKGTLNMRTQKCFAVKYASDENNFVIITGPNMGGKSTYLRQIVLLQVMAQIGSYVPAEIASFRICDQIFSRIGSDDDILTNSSTFMLEMREINYILQNASRNSLIIIDELGRGTSADEGVGICHSICEYLLNIKAFTFFATHFMDLTNLDSLYPNVENYHFEVHHTFLDESNKEKVSYTHTLSKGKTTEKHYGLQLAEISTLPRCVMENARKLVEKITDEMRKSNVITEDAVKQRAVFKLGTRVAQTALNSKLDTDSLKTYLISLRNQYIADIQLGQDAN
ncbi:hypothetical protein LSH36_68g11029 [Paralvinella palmiformis]|uniref:DNA mismatch repair proteins mutS family domain-containing protein n=1 Tax=Paralvinella palmiformis TaxID=53620 RepID=A0AAD9K3E5_9ANNE|nr:hypothetical protein LSH36_68g11029 [Paralvinella palmiformis]